MVKRNFDLGFFTPSPQITLRPLQRKVGFHIPVVLIFTPWSVCWKKDLVGFPERICRVIDKNDSIPYIKWEPAKWTATFNKMINAHPLEDIIKGKFDDHIRQWALGAKKFKNRLWLSFGHEMNGKWYFWAGRPSVYKKAFLHVYMIFKELKVKNVRWVFCVNNYPIDYADYFPNELKSDRNIMVGIDGYNAEGIWGLHWKPFRDIFKGPYIYKAKKFPGKKIIIGELGCAKKGGDKKAWIDDLFICMKKDFPKISTIIWFNINKEADWRFTSF